MKVAGYNDMSPIIPEGQVGDFKITHRTKPKDEVAFDTVMRSKVDWTMRFARSGTYCILHNVKEADEVLMSDTDMERTTNRHALQDAKGHVLIGGLGIGMLPYHMCRKKKVESVTVLELQEEVIDLVAPHIRHPKLRVIQGDVHYPPALPWWPEFDYIYLDIWQQVRVEWVELEKLMTAYQEYLAPGGKVDAWLADYVRILDTLGIGQLPSMYRPASGWLSPHARREYVEGLAK